MTDRSADLPEATFREMRSRARDVFEHALDECNIAKAFSRHLHYSRGYLEIGNDVYGLDSFARTLVLSIGKAGHAMAEAVAAIIPGRTLTGIVAAASSPSAEVPGFSYFIGGHPLPNRDSLVAADALLKAAASSSPQTLVLFLISGGASALAEKPLSPKITFADLVETYKVLVHSGAPIAQINAIRKHLSAIKGGRLAQAAVPAFQASILVSDVPEASIDALASGPTMPDSTTVADCYEIAKRYKLLKPFPASVRRMFEDSRLTETPKPGDAVFARSRYHTVLSNATAVNAAVERVAMGGFAVEVDNTCDDWDYQAAADHLLRRLRELRRGVSRACLISGGEVTVRVSGNSGIGGRNQQFSLYCAEKIPGENITVLSAGTDGIDGNSPAAGAIADGTTLKRARDRGFQPSAALAEFNAFPVFDALGDSLMTGPTGNNVRDLRILFAY